MLHSLYNLITSLSLPLAFIRLYLKSIRQPAYRLHLSERLSLKRQPQSDIWIHAVSVGEIHTCLHLIASWKKASKLQIFISCGTPTGRQRIKQWLDTTNHHNINYGYLPFDQPLLIQRALKQVKPKVLAIIETEIWPNLVFYAHNQGTKTLLLNARLSQRSARKYALFAQFSRYIFNHFDLVLAQTKADITRIQMFLQNPELCIVVGNIKFDFSVKVNSYLAKKILSTVGERSTVFTIGSSRFGEEKPLFNAINALLTEQPDALICWAPRHIEKSIDSIKTMARKHNIRLTMCSDNNASKSTNILIIDTFGELATFYSLANIVFIGGTLVDTGAQNLIEPALLAKPIISGPSHFNFTEAFQLLKTAGALTLVESGKTLTTQLLQLAQDTQLQRKLGAAGRNSVHSKQGATKQTIKNLQAMIS